MKKLLIPMFALGAAIVAQPALAADAEALFNSKGCVACHTVDTKLVGPALKDVAAKNADVEGAAENLAASIQNGSSGTWGPIPMPPNAVSAEEAAALAEWVLGL
ncbi:MAG TPA: c-type cytochrome [Alcanivoracaceae bacterium]|nr:c-type cytochrome [Alcanivoracaceae bacterium]